MIRGDTYAPFVEELEGEVVDGNLPDAEQCFRDVLDQPNGCRHFLISFATLWVFWDLFSKTFLDLLVQLCLSFTFKALLCQTVILYRWHFEVSLLSAFSVLTFLQEFCTFSDSLLAPLLTLPELASALISSLWWKFFFLFPLNPRVSFQCCFYKIRCDLFTLVKQFLLVLV